MYYYILSYVLVNLAAMTICFKDAVNARDGKPTLNKSIPYLIVLPMGAIGVLACRIAFGYKKDNRRYILYTAIMTVVQIAISIVALILLSNAGL